MARRPVPNVSYANEGSPGPNPGLGLAGRLAAQRGRPFTPFQMPERPPAGTYDPMLDSQQAAAARGLGDLQQDIGLQGARSLTDYMTATNRMNLQRQYEQQDYARNTGLLQRRFNILGSQQGQAANAAGLEDAGGSGFDAASAAARAQNQGIQQQQMDIAHQRAVTGEDLAQAQLGLQYNRAGEDRSIMGSRAGRENAFFGQDIGAERGYQSAFMGYVPPSPPANEFTRAGLTYQLGQNGMATLPSGQMLSPGQLNSTLYQRGWRPRGWRPGQAIPGVGGAPALGGGSAGGWGSSMSGMGQFGGLGY